MTDAWFIKRDGQTLIVLDLNHYGQAACQPFTSPAAEADARFITEALNARDKK